MNTTNDMNELVKQLSVEAREIVLNAPLTIIAISNSGIDNEVVEAAKSTRPVFS